MVLPKKLKREVSRAVSKLRLRGWCRGRTPLSTGVMSDRGDVTSFDVRGGINLLVDDDEFWRPNRWPRPFVMESFVALCKLLVSLRR
jgi:hypothetical protein